MNAKDNIKNAIYPEQVRAARGLLNWSQEDLAVRSGVPKRTIAACERSERAPYRRTLESLRAALEDAGARFFGETGTYLSREERDSYFQGVIYTAVLSLLRSEQSPVHRLAGLFTDALIHLRPQDIPAEMSEDFQKIHDVARLCHEYSRNRREMPDERQLRETAERILELYSALARQAP